MIIILIISVISLSSVPCSAKKVQTSTFKPKINKVFTNSIGMQMIPVADGEFEMGNPDPGIQEWDEVPVHKVTLSGFYMSETEITVEQFKIFRPEFSGSMMEYPYVVGVSWEDAMAFCRWLSEKEGVPYRLPTESEWEYACRSGTNTPYWSGENPPEKGTSNPWGFKNMHSGPREWCYDWYDQYSQVDQLNPIGAENGMARVIRGGGDEHRAYYGRSFNRSGYAPTFRQIVSEEERIIQDPYSDDEIFPGLAGVWYGRLNFERPRGFEVLKTLEADFKAMGRVSNSWAGRYKGIIIAPFTGTVNFKVYSDKGAILEIDTLTLVNWNGKADERSGNMEMEEGKSYPITVSYFHEDGPESVLQIYWSWEGQDFHPVSGNNLQHTWRQELEGKGITDAALGLFKPIGFRVVQAEMPDSRPTPVQKPFVQQCIVQDQPLLRLGPDPDKPWYRKRYLLPMPPDNVPREETRIAGFHPGMMNHNHSPTLEVCPNGDLLFISYTSKREYEPEVSFLATRLRFGAAEWDMPEIIFDFPDANDHAPCLYTEGERMFFFWGTAGLKGVYPFQWITSDDNGATWSEVQFPKFTGKIGPHFSQPINTVFRDRNGTLYVPNDGEGQTSVLFASKDNGRTWYDTGGRSAGRHTTYVELKDGSILGMGGKNTNIDGYMPKAVSSDGGKTWVSSKTPFAALGGNQRPCIVRLQSGNLFFCGDFQAKDGTKPEGIKESGSYVALSADEGETWHIKKLVGTLPHETDLKAHTLGYSVARQAPNGIIHITSSMNTPCLHFEINEAWILSDEAGFQDHSCSEVNEVREYQRFYPSGQLRAKWQAGVTEEGEYVLHGNQVWYYENGSKQYEVVYEAGHKTGNEILWDKEGRKVWNWKYDDKGKGIWTRYYRNEQMKSKSTWQDFRANGPSRRWSVNGEVISDVMFDQGRVK